MFNRKRNRCSASPSDGGPRGGDQQRRRGRGPGGQPCRGSRPLLLTPSTSLPPSRLWPWLHSIRITLASLRDAVLSLRIQLPGRRSRLGSRCSPFVSFSRWGLLILYLYLLFHICIPSYWYERIGINKVIGYILPHGPMKALPHSLRPPLSAVVTTHALNITFFPTSTVLSNFKK